MTCKWVRNYGGDVLMVHTDEEPIFPLSMTGEEFFDNKDLAEEFDIALKEIEDYDSLEDYDDYEHHGIDKIEHLIKNCDSDDTHYYIRECERGFFTVPYSEDLVYDYE